MSSADRDHGSRTGHPRNRRTLAEAARHASIVAISHAHARSFGDIPVAAVIHHGIDLDVYTPGPGTGGYLLFTGRMSADKGVHHAVRVARRAGWPLVITAKIREPAERAYFDQQVRPLLGPDDDMLAEQPLAARVELMRHAAALLNPITWPEPFGLVMAEALAAATPVLAFPNGAAPEIIDHGRTGYLCRGRGRDDCRRRSRAPDRPLAVPGCRRAAVLPGPDGRRLRAAVPGHPGTSRPGDARPDRNRHTVTAPWSAGEAPAIPGLPGTVTLVEGSTFCISQSSGDILPGEPQGLFVQDTRVLSGWSLTVDGRPAEPLTVQRADPYAAAFLGRLPPPPGAPADAAMLIVRRRYIGDGMREDIAIHNTARLPAVVVVTLTADADFADLFEVKAGLAQPAAAVQVAATDSALTFDARRNRHSHGLVISGDGDPAAAPGALSWRAVVPARGEWLATVEVVPARDGIPMRLHHPRGQPVEHAVPARRLRDWRRAAPRVTTPDRDLAAVLHRSVDDIGALHIFDPAHPDRPVVAAGAPGSWPCSGATRCSPPGCCCPGTTAWPQAHCRPWPTARATPSTRQQKKNRAGSCTRSGSARPP